MRPPKLSLNRSAAIGALLAFLLLAPVAAQTISGIVAGTVRDQSGAIVQAATVEVKNPLTGRTYNTSSDTNGYYRIPEVPPGSYSLTVSFSGFKTVERKGVIVSVNKVSVENVELQVAAVTGEVEVQDSRSQPIDTTGPTLSTSLSEKQVRELPILTRDINNLALLAPGVLSVRSFSFSSTLVPFSSNGSRGRDNNFIIDSVDNNEPLFGGAATQFTNTDIFAEYTILTNQLKAEFGRNSGATVNVITKQGSNRISGSAFWFGQHDNLNTRSQVESAALLSEPARYYENQIGATLGGPFVKDKAFYYFSYQNDSATTNLSEVFPVVATYPTPAGLATLRTLPQSGTLLALEQVASVTSIPALMSPCFSSLPDPMLAPGFNTTNPCRNTAVVPIGTTNTSWGTYLVPNSNVFDVHDTQFSGRFDAILGSNDDFYARYLFDELSTPRIPLAPAGDAAFADLGLFPDWRLITRQRTQSLLLNERHFFSQKKLNEFRFSYSRVSLGIGPFHINGTVRANQPSASVVDNFGGFGAFQQNFFSTGRRFTIGRDSSPSQTDSNIFQWQDNFSMIAGKHSLKFGVNFVRIQSDILSIPGDLGMYDFEPNLGVGGLENFAREPVSGATRSVIAFQRLANVFSDPAGVAITGQGSPVLRMREFDQFYFIQDDWRVSSEFTVSFGLRYENFGQPINRVRESNSRAPSALRDDNNFAPRFGFAWNPWRRIVVRGGYALMYNPIVLNIPLLIWQSGPISPQFVAFTFPGGVVQSVLRPSGSFPRKPISIADVNAARVSGCSTVIDLVTVGTVPLLNCASQDTVAGNLKNPYVHQFTLGIQTEVARNLALEVGYVGSKGTKLFQRVDENPLGGWAVNGRGATSPCPTFSIRPGCLNPRRTTSRGAITRVTNGGSSKYHSLQTSLIRRLSRFGEAGDLGFTIAYTYSHNIDNASEIFGPGVRFLCNNSPSLQQCVQLVAAAQGLDVVEAITPLAQDSNNFHPERANSSFDRRHRFVASYLWGPRPSDRNLLTGGWQFAGIITAQSGQPFSPLNGSPFGNCVDYNGDGRLTNDRPAIGNPNAPESTIALIDTSVNPTCSRNGTLVYRDASGAVINPADARFVQVPLGVAPYQPFTVGTATFFAGSAGRNSLMGPNLINWDLSLLKAFHFGERWSLQFRWEVYNVLNRKNYGNAIGNAFATDAQPTPGFAFSPRYTAAGVTGVIPENALDATVLVPPSSGSGAGQVVNAFLTTRNMNTSTRRMQFGLKLIF
jgi:hypothetical protein